MATTPRPSDPGHQILATRSWLWYLGWLPDLTLARSPGCQILATTSRLPDHGYQIQTTRSCLPVNRFWLPHPGHHVLATRSWLISDPGRYQILGTRSSLPASCCHILAPRFWLPHPGYHDLATRSWLIPDPGYQIPRSWVPDPGYQIRGTRSRLPNPC